MQMQRYFFKLMALAMVMVPISGLAQEKTASCYAHIDYGEPVSTLPTRALYIVVDQTMEMSDNMPQKIEQLIADWGRPGDLIKVARFSANMREHYPSVEYQFKHEPKPTEKYLFGLRWADKKQLEECLARQEGDSKAAFSKALGQVFAGVNPKTPKTDIFQALKQLSKHMLDNDVQEKVVLLVSDGLENSAVTSFYHKGKIRKIDSRKEIAKLRRQGLVSHWAGARIYMYGLGLPPKKQKYMDMNTAKALSKFWEHYFVEGEAKVAALGSPELLISSVE